MAVSLELWEGGDAVRRLLEPDFVERWLALHRICPWATPFQHPAFVNTWYASYHSRSTPIVAAGFDETGLLAGLLLLAKYEGRVVGAGARQAEYQVWLALPEVSRGFASRAILAARAGAPQMPFQLKYIPANAGVIDVMATPGLRRYTEVIGYPRPLMRIDPVEISASMKKKGNASRLNRLKREGVAKLERIQDAPALERNFDEIIALYDFRQGAVNGDCPFADDVLKRDFHVAWMAAAGPLHVTVLRSSGRVVSAVIGVMGRESVHVAIITHSPFYARHSPGKLHLMLLGLELAAEGIEYLDLTPGGSWKERFADAHDTVFELRVHRRRFNRVLAVWLDRARATVKRVIQAVGMDLKAVSGVVASVRRGRIGSIVGLLWRWVKYDAELRLYAIQPSAGPTPDSATAIRKDRIEDLLAFRPAESWQSRHAFLSSALERMERGEHVFTISDGQRLLHYGWLVEEQSEAFFAEVGQPFRFPEPSPVLYDFYTDPTARGRGYYRQNLCHMLREIAAPGTAKHAYICALSGNVPSLRVIEKIGFEYRGSLWHRRRLGRDVRWRTTTEPSGRP